MVKILLTTLFLFVTVHCFAQSESSQLFGYWKFTKIKYLNNFSIDIDSLDAARNNFFEKQRLERFAGQLNKSDSAQLKQAFEGFVKEINSMYIKFMRSGNYETNRYKEGELEAGKAETGAYNFDLKTGFITLRVDGNKTNESKLRVLKLTKTSLTITSATGGMAPVMTCKKVSN